MSQKVNVRCMLVLAAALTAHAASRFVPPADQTMAQASAWNLAQRLKCTSTARSQGNYGFSADELKEAIITEMANRGHENFMISKKGSMGMFPNGAKTTKAELMRALRQMLETDREIIIAGDRVAVFGATGSHMGVVKRVWTNPKLLDDPKHRWGEERESKRSRWGPAGTLWRRIVLDNPTMRQKDHAWARQVFNADGHESKIYRIQRAEDTGVGEDEEVEGEDDAASEAGPGSNSDAMSVASTRAAAQLGHAHRILEVLDPLPENELAEQELYVEDASQLAGPAHGVNKKDRQEYGVGDEVVTNREVRAFVVNWGWLARHHTIVEGTVPSGEHGKIRTILSSESQDPLQIRCKHDTSKHDELPAGSALVRFDTGGDRWLRPCDMSDRNCVDVTKHEPWCGWCRRRRKEE